MKYMRAQKAILLTTAIPPKRVIHHQNESENVPQEDQELYAMMSDIGKQYSVPSLIRIGLFLFRPPGFRAEQYSYE